MYRSLRQEPGTMDKQTDGPQLATRHAKDRRPAFNTKAARSLAAFEQRLEQRLARIEGKNAVSPPSPKTSAALDLDTEFNSFGQMFNDLEERVTDLETAGPQSGLEPRLTALIEQRIKPYNQYQMEASNAVQQLKSFQDRIRSFSTGKLDPETLKLVNDHEASLREFTGRILQVENQIELAKAQTLSTSDLAKALLQRLQRGDIIARTVSHDLRLALDGAADAQSETIIAPPPRLPDTPATDEAGVRQSMVEESVEDEDSSPKKRRRTKQQKTPRSAKVAGRGRESEPVSTPQCESALSAFGSGGLAIDYEGSEDMAEGVDIDGFVIPPEVRRTSRKPMPTKQHGDMLHWKEANRRLRGTG
ncbi:hypothetical protein LTR85_008342 [Meristemomyces frigidus]|nr:hypothetical protein LTR85_008342 [Meristemomyces frigidus]